MSALSSKLIPLLLAGSLLHATEFYVGPAGDDANPGTAALPFASLDRARQAVRTVNASMSEDVIVHLAPGDYPVSSPVEFEPLDSGFNGHEVIYRASGEPGSARLVGGELVAYRDIPLAISTASATISTTSAWRTTPRIRETPPPSTRGA